MLYIGDLTEKDKGRMVIYLESFSKRKEEGVITSWNDSYIFVRYINDVGSKATRPNDLSWSYKIG